MARLLVLVVSLVIFSHNTLKAMAQITTIAPELIEANEGDNATFNCSEAISLADFTVGIQRPGDMDFSTLPISDPRLSVEEVNVTAVFTYGPVERAEDETLFRCNLGGVPSTNFATLRVYYPPEYVNPGMQSIIEGNDFMLDLDLTANPIPVDYQWMKDGVNITNGGRLTLTVDRIAIEGTLRGDATTYTLTATNLAGTDTISFVLDVLYAPEPGPLGGTLAAQCNPESSPMTCNIMTGDTGTLECTAGGNPTPTFEVTSNAMIQPGFSGATIQITNAAPGNTGLYTCSFNNSVDSVTRDFQLNVGTIPDLVNVTAVESGDNVVISWVLLEPSAHVLVITYQITFTSDSADTFEVTEERNMEVTIAHNDLEAKVVYTVTVTGTNVLGTSEPITTTYQLVDCGTLMNPMNGQVNFIDTTLGADATYTCNEGFPLVGVDTRTCEANGEWSDSEPTCGAEIAQISLLVLTLLVTIGLAVVGF